MRDNNRQVGREPCYFSLYNLCGEYLQFMLKNVLFSIAINLGGESRSFKKYFLRKEIMKKSNRIYLCSLLLMICNFFVSIPAHTNCELPATTHAENVNALTPLLPGDARGVLAVDIHDLLSGSSATTVTGLLNGQGSDAALNEPLSAIAKRMMRIYRSRSL